MRFRSVITRLRRANIAAIAASDSACSTRGTPAQLGEGFARQVILRRAQAAGDDDQIGSLGRGPEDRDMVRQRVAQCGVQADRDSQIRKLAAEPLAVGIERLTAHQLAADRDDFSPHGSFSLPRPVYEVLANIEGITCKCLWHHPFSVG